MVDQDAAHHCMMGSLKEACTKLTIWREMAQWPVSDPDLQDQSWTPEGGGTHITMDGVLFSHPAATGSMLGLEI